VAQVPSPGDPLEPAFPAEYSALFDVMLVSPKDKAKAETKTSSGFFMNIGFNMNKNGCETVHIPDTKLEQ
jgi:hypothetical protein